MKLSLVIFFLAFFPIKKLSACSESGQMDFKITKAKQRTCAKLAQKYAMSFASTMVKIEQAQKGYKGPDGNFKVNKPMPSVYMAKTRVGNSSLIGFNVGLDSKNKWECNFCVNMSVDADENCAIESVEKFMCAQ